MKSLYLIYRGWKIHHDPHKKIYWAYPQFDFSKGIFLERRTQREMREAIRGAGGRKT